MTNYPDICVNKGKEFIFLFSAEVRYILSNGSYSELYLTDDRKVTLSKNLKQIESIVDDSIFVRIHNSVIVNLMYLEKVHLQDTMEVELDGGEKLPISRRKKSEFMQRFTKI